MPERSDDELLAMIGDALRATDPVPPDVHDRAVAAYELRDLDARLAELVDETSLVRAADGSQLVFAAEHAEIALEVLAGRVHGLVAPGAACAGAVIVPGQDPVPFRTDELGRFSVAVPGGVLRVVLDHPDGGVRTDWFHAPQP